MTIVKLLVEYVDLKFLVTAYDEVGKLEIEEFKQRKMEAISKAMNRCRELLGPEVEFRLEEIYR